MDYGCDVSELLNAYICSSLNTLRQRENVRHLADDIFKCIFFNENVRILIEISLKFVPRIHLNWQSVSIGSGNGLAPNRWQAITWTNDDPVQWLIYASPGLSELTYCFPCYWVEVSSYVIEVVYNHINKCKFFLTSLNRTSIEAHLINCQAKLHWIQVHCFNVLDGKAICLRLS